MSNEMNQESPTPLVLTELHEDGVAVLTLNNGKVNPLSVELLNELQSAASQLAANQQVRAVVIAGNERAFAAGADIAQFAESEVGLSSPERIAQIGAAFLGALNAVAALPCPTIASVSGVALGGGCELALACDFRVAGTKSRFGQPEILLGIIPGGGGTQRLSRLVGSSVAKELIFSGRMVQAEEALSIGLVNEIFEADQVLSGAMAMAQSFACGPRHALALAKAAIDQGLEVSLDEGLLLEQALFVKSFTTPDAAVGVSSFLAAGPGHADFS
jgi:enoyl-CoA hydratase/carnithine racemase